MSKTHTASRYLKGGETKKGDTILRLHAPQRAIVARGSKGDSITKTAIEIVEPKGTRGGSGSVVRMECGLSR